MMPRIDLDRLTNRWQRMNDKVKIITKSIIEEAICLSPYLRHRMEHVATSEEDLKEEVGYSH